MTWPQGSRFERIEVRFTTEVGDTIRVYYEPERRESAVTHSVGGT
ncbi:hypothetical protein [Streptomyces niveus]